MNSAIVLSILTGRAQSSLENHRRYAHRSGYRHDIVDISDVHEDPQFRMLYKYEVLLHTLRRALPEQLVVLLTENGAVIDPVPLEILMRGRDWLIAENWSKPLPLLAVQIWRNTEIARAQLSRMIEACRFGNEHPPSENELFENVESLKFGELVESIYPIMPCAANVDPAWTRLSTFAIDIGGSPNRPQRSGVCQRFRKILIRHINERRATGSPLLSFPDNVEAADLAERSTFQPGRKIALTTLYTSNLTPFARIAERNMRRYCERHGYTFYVHRDIPAEVGIRGSGNWLKPWLLAGYLKHHEWVVWLDADMLIADQSRPLELEMQGRDWLLARDLGEWPVNAGLIGVRRTSSNQAMLETWMKSIAALPDRSGVYVENGDQYHLIEALKTHDLLDEALISDWLDFNTPWMFRRPDSFIVHYFGMWPEMRALMMSHDDAWSC